MTIFLSILKVIGIILLIILALIVLLLLLILFYPIGYKTQGNYKDGDMHVTAKAGWIFHIIRALFTLDNKDIDYSVKILFFKVYPPKDKAEDSGVLGERKPPVSDDEEEPSSFSKIKCKISELYDKINRIYKKIKHIMFMAKDERDQEAVRELCRRVFGLIKRILPRKKSIYLKLGMDDPSQTGEIAGLIYSLSPIYRGDLRFVPVFDEKVIEGDLFFKGHIQLIFVLIAAARIYFNKDIRRLYRQIQKVRTE